jgi:hypothetical protein
MNNAINAVTTMFERKKEARKEMYKQHVLNIPYFPMYQQHRGRPPLDPRIVVDIQRALHTAEARMRQGIDQDWKDCVVRYPQVLAHYYNQVQMQIPAQATSPFGQALSGGGQPRPPSVVNMAPPPPQSMVGMSMQRSATVPPKKNRERRSSKVNLDMGGPEGDVMALLSQKLEGMQGLGQAAGRGRTKAATPAPSTPAPPPRSGTARPSNKRRESKEMRGGFLPPPPPQAPHAPQQGYDMRTSFLGNLGSFGSMGH